MTGENEIPDDPDILFRCINCDWFWLDDDDVRELNRIFNILDVDGPEGLEGISGPY